MVIGMNRRFRAERRAEMFIGAVGDDFVDIHICLGARTGLPDAEGEMRVERAGEDVIGGEGDGVGQMRGELPGLAMKECRGFLDEGERVDDGQAHSLLADCKVLPRAFGLCAPIAVGCDVDRSHAIGFGAG